MYIYIHKYTYIHCYFQGVKITPILLLFGGVKILKLV